MLMLNGSCKMDKRVMKSADTSRSGADVLILQKVINSPIEINGNLDGIGHCKRIDTSG